MMDKKCIFITGAASGIGKSVACLFAEKGWFVGLFDTDQTALNDLSKEIGGEICCAQKMDVTQPDQVGASIRFFGKQTDGRMDLLFNSAGIYRVGPFESLELNEQSRIIEINVIGVMNCIHSAFNMLKQTSDSRIITMGSSSGVYGTPEITAYSTSKCAVRGMTEALNIEFERYDINVCDIMVPFVQTPLVSKAKESTAQQNMGVHLTAEQVAQLAWKAAHRKKVHWSLRLKSTLFLIWLLPFATRSIIKRITWNHKDVKS